MFGQIGYSASRVARYASRPTDDPVSPSRPGASEHRASRATVESTTAGIPADLTAEEQAAVQELSARDRQVGSHEPAHKAAGRAHAGAATFDHAVGPNGQRHATRGEVPADLAPVPGDTDATIEKMEDVARAALAPRHPSSQDRAVAARERQLATAARQQQVVQDIRGPVPPAVDFQA